MSTTTASPNQLRLIASLYEERNLADYSVEKCEAIKALLKGELVIARSSASTCISELFALPKLTTPAQRVAVPDGRYAVEVDGTLKFYRVTVPTEGRWVGYTFVKVQASDDYYPVKGAAANKVLAQIAEVGPREASVRYGRELGQCGVCGRTLTDEDSRAAGIGPVCASKF